MNINRSRRVLNLKIFSAARRRVGGAILASAILLAGCTVVPKGENRLRRAAAIAGKLFEKPYARRHLPPLSVNATSAQLVRYAVLNNPVVEKAYWKWRWEIEEIPQAGTQATTLVLNAGTTLQNGQASLANTILGASNASDDIRWPSKLSVQARAALQAARAAGWRYRAEIFSVRRAVLTAWYEYALTAVTWRLERDMKHLLKAEAALLRAGIGAGGRQPRLWLAVQVRIDQHQAVIVALHHQLALELAALNALLGRAAKAPLNPPRAIPHPDASGPAISDRRLLILAMRRNPELRGLRRFVSAGRLSIRRAKMQYIPNFDLGLSTSLDGAMQNFTGALLIPALRYEAIHASIAQARDRLRATRAALRGKKDDLAARLLIDIIALRSDRRQLALFAESILPRLKVIAALDRADYQQGATGVQNQLETEHMILGVRETIADLQADQAERIADIDAVIAAPLEPASSLKGEPAPRS